MNVSPLPQGGFARYFAINLNVQMALLLYTAMSLHLFQETSINPLGRLAQQISYGSIESLYDVLYRIMFLFLLKHVLGRNSCALEVFGLVPVGQEQEEGKSEQRQL